MLCLASLPGGPQSGCSPAGGTAAPKYAVGGRDQGINDYYLTYLLCTEQDYDIACVSLQLQIVNPLYWLIIARVKCIAQVRLVMR